MSDSLSATADAELVGLVPEERAAAWPAVFALSMGVFALVSAEFLPASVLTSIAADLSISVGAAGQSADELLALHETAVRAADEAIDRALAAAETTLNGVVTKSRYWVLLAQKQLNDRQKLMVNKLLDGFEGKLNTSKWAKITKVSTDTALRDIQNLVEQAVLEKEDSGGRSTSYRLVELADTNY